MSRPKHLFKAWSTIRRFARQANRLALFADFDGTLAPICSRPGEARMPAKVRRLLPQVEQSGTTVAIVSGRKIQDVCRRVGLRSVWYVGAHGFSLRSPGGRTVLLTTPAERHRIRRLEVALRRKLKGVRGIEIEPKTATVAVHYRRARCGQRDAAWTVLQGLVRKISGVKLLEGKKVWEILPDRQIDKWTAVKSILRRKRRTQGSLLLFYLGDDTTDEAVFRKMKGISVAVGKRHKTAARFYLRSPAEVGRFLEKWVELAE